MTDRLLPLLPLHKTYVEVFGGAASLLFAKPQSKVEVYNDLNSDVVDFFRIFHDLADLKQLRRKLFYTPWSRELYKEFQRNWHLQEDRVERIYRWFVVQRMSYSGMGAAVGTCFKRKRNVAAYFRWTCDNLDIFVDRLRHVQIENESWEVILERYDGTDTLFYLDPPYVPETRVAPDMYKHEMSLPEHKQLLEAIAKLKGAVALSGYPNPYYDSLQWKRTDIDTFSQTSLGHNTDARRVESVWTNYEIQPQLF